MALIVEDGTGKPDAESYAAVAAADSYHSLRSNAAWSVLDVTRKESALRVATDCLESFRWRGQRASADQALAWPRSGAVVDGVEMIGVPARLAKACCELALRASEGRLIPDQLRPATKRRKADEVEVEYFGSVPLDFEDRFPYVARLLSGLYLDEGDVSSASGSIRLVRA